MYYWALYRTVKLKYKFFDELEIRGIHFNVLYFYIY